MGLTPEAWQQQEREIIDRFFKVRVPEVLKDGAEILTTTTCTEDSCIEFGKQVLHADDLELVQN